MFVVTLIFDFAVTLAPLSPQPIVRRYQHGIHHKLRLRKEQRVDTSERGHLAAEFDVDVVREDTAGVDSSADLHWTGDHHPVSRFHSRFRHM